MKYIIYILFVTGCYLSVTHWLNNFNVSPDSSNFITASENLVKHKSLFVYANWPSQSFEPETEPYTEYMPGLPVFSSVMFLFTDNPDTVMLVVNSLNIVLLYIIALMLLNELGMNFYFKFIFLLFLTFFEPFRFIYSYFWTETLFISFSLLALLFAVKLLKEDNKKYWVLGCIAVVLCSFVKMYGVFNCAFFIVPFVMHKKKFSKLIVFILTSSVLVILWYMRNELSYGYFTSSHKIFGQFIASNLSRPFKWTLFILGNNKLANIWAIILFSISISPLLLYWKKRLNETTDFRIWSVLVTGALINFLAIYLLSLVSSFDYLESRLMAPVYIMCLLIFLISIKILCNKGQEWLSKAKYILYVLPLIFFIVNPAFTKEIETKVSIAYHPEHELWNEIYQKKYGANSSHYITDLDYSHQIYEEKPQRIIRRDFMFLNIEFLQKIVNIGKSPFVVLKNNELSYFYFEKLYKTLNYKKAEIQNKDFTVYVKNN